jgi:serine/threonine-protein kinase HipA
MYRRMVYNICSRNQDDHTKNHAFLMFGDGVWQLSPAYDLCFSYKPGNRFIEQHQMACNGKRDHFDVTDLLEAGKAADVKRPRDIIAEVEQATSDWFNFADLAGIHEAQAASIGNLHRRFIG